MDEIKIDHSFVGKLEEETGSRVLVKGIIGLVHALGFKVMAEGVEIETAGQFEQLQGMGFDMAQGYHFSRPLPSDAALSLLENQAR